MSHPRPFRIGLVVLAVLSVFDLLLPLATDGQSPPMPVALAAAGLGLASLVLVLSAWRGATRAVPPLVGLRLLSALSAVPAFFGSGVPGPAIIAAALVAVATVVGVALVLSPSRRRTMAGSR
ncbi:MAG TPA: hypothetical protein VMM13_10720 [Euzebya sp.]|nr:hypothetical protein [Euzebya sp.]